MSLELLIFLTLGVMKSKKTFLAKEILDSLYKSEDDANDKDNFSIHYIIKNWNVI